MLRRVRQHFAPALFQPIGSSVGSRTTQVIHSKHLHTSKPHLNVHIFNLMNANTTTEREKRKKTFSADTLFESRHFLVDPRATTKSLFMPKIAAGENFCMVAPCQTGKTTMALALVEQLQDAGYFPILYVCSYYQFTCCSLDMQRVVSQMISTGATFRKAFFSVIQATNRDCTYDSKYSDLCDFFVGINSKLIFQCKDVVLLCDNIDALGTVNDLLDGKGSDFALKLEIGRVTFLADLISIRDAIPGTYCLHSVVGITNFVGRYLESTIGTTALAIRQQIAVPYFTIEQVFDLAQQWENQEDAKIDPNIKENIFEVSSGAQGTVMILFKYYVETLRPKNLQKYEREPTFGDWLIEYWTEEFLNTIILGYSNYQQMADAISSPEILAELEEWSTDRRLTLSDNVKAMLMKSNIIRRHVNGRIGFASPLVERYVNLKMRESKDEEFATNSSFSTESHY